MQKRLSSFLLAVLMVMSIIPMTVFSSFAAVNGNGALYADRTLSVGCKGDDVKEVQQKLYELGYLTVKPDGVYGAKSRDAVIAFQVYHGLESPDGKVGNWTRGALYFNPISYRTLKKGVAFSSKEKAVVKSIQKRLVDLGYLHSTPDGSYGNMTYQAVVNFQKANGIYADGTVGRVTVVKMFSNPVRYTIKLSRTLCYGNSGSDVKEVQTSLKCLGFLNVTPDGKYGAVTEAAGKLFQAYNGLSSPDGKMGSWTLGKLNGKPSSFVMITNGYKGNSVKVMQTYLKKLGYLYTNADGVYGSQSEKAVKKFQAANGLSTASGLNVDTMLRIFSRSNVDAKTANSRVSITLTTQLPFASYYNGTISQVNSCKITVDSEANYDGTYNVEITGTFTIYSSFYSGKNYAEADYQLLNSDGVIVENGSLYFREGFVGDTMSYSETLWRMEPGYYTLILVQP